jgi:hypothetical protein
MKLLLKKQKDKYFAENGKEGKGLTVYKVDKDGEFINGDFYEESSKYIKLIW